MQRAGEARAWCWSNPADAGTTYNKIMNGHVVRSNPRSRGDDLHMAWVVGAHMELPRSRGELSGWLRRFRRAWPYNQRPPS
ncbi:hypothetical protein ACFQ3Z_45870 [Streptomyces nogalater]